MSTLYPQYVPLYLHMLYEIIHAQVVKRVFRAKSKRAPYRYTSERKGRPRTRPSDAVHISAYLDRSEAEFYKTLGNGNVTQGIRALAQIGIKRMSAGQADLSKS